MTAEADSELGTRPLLRRQLDALADWLAKDHWTLPEAAALLVGFVPLDGDGGARPFGPWLPGREPWPQRETWEWAVGREMDDMRQRLATIPNLGFKAPTEIVAFAFKNGIVPPWLDAAKGDLACAALLPANVFESQPEGADERHPLRKAQQQRRRDQLAADDKQKLIEGAGRAAFDQIRNADFAGYRKPRGKINVAALARAIREAIEAAAKGEPESWPELRTLENRVNEWLAATNPKNETLG